MRTPPVRALRSRVDENRSVTDRLTGRNPENPAAVKPEPANDTKAKGASKY
jgi:hypothetical protein